MTCRSLPRAVVALVGALSVGLLAGSASAGVNTPVPFPASPSGLPAPGPVGDAVDFPSPYQAQLSCAVVPLPGTVMLRDLVLETYERGYDGGTIRSCVVGSTSEHKEGRGWDWMPDFDNTADRRAAADFLAWVTQDEGTIARRLGIMYVIYNKRIWSTWSPSWESYEGSDPHTSHVHVSLGWNGARGHTSFWTGRTWAQDYGTCEVFHDGPATVAVKQPRTTPCLASVKPARSLDRPMLWMGSTGDDVRVVQRQLGASVSGTFDTDTRSRVLRFQRHHDLPRTGAADRATWAALLPDQATSLHPEWTATEAATWIRDVAGSPVLHRGSSGRAVTALQATLGLAVDDRTGFYGPRTRALVTDVRQAHGRTGGRTTRSVWRMLG